MSFGTRHGNTRTENFTMSGFLDCSACFEEPIYSICFGLRIWARIRYSFDICRFAWTKALAKLRPMEVQSFIRETGFIVGMTAVKSLESVRADRMRGVKCMIRSSSALGISVQIVAVRRRQFRLQHL
jgi:hypothetical protein